jgi:DNA-binding LytR/AlgR family response regulator
MNRPTAIIVEDEPLLLAELKEALAALWPELAIVAEAEDGVQAVRALESQRADILFLDIELPRMNGLEVAALASGRSHVVFVTAYDRYAVAAFDRGAVDYLLKPLSRPRLASAVARLRERLRDTPARLEGLLQMLADRGTAARPYLRWICVEQGRSMQLITCEEICYFQADNKYTLVATAGGESLINKTIRELVGELDPEIFLQIHRGTVVNVNAIAAIDRDLRGGLKLRLRRRDERLAVSATFAHHFRHM